MRKTIFALALLCFFSGCAGQAEEKSPAKAQKQRYKGLPVEIVMPSDKGLPVELQVKADEGIPVKLDDRKPLAVELKTPIKLDIQTAKPLPVDVNIRGDKKFRVEVEPSGWIVAAAIGTILTAFFAGCAAVAAWLSASKLKRL